MHTLLVGLTVPALVLAGLSAEAARRPTPLTTSPTRRVQVVGADIAQTAKERWVAPVVADLVGKGHVMVGRIQAAASAHGPTSLTDHVDRDGDTSSWGKAEEDIAGLVQVRAKQTRHRFPGETRHSSELEVSVAGTTGGVRLWNEGSVKSGLRTRAVGVAVTSAPHEPTSAYQRRNAGDDGLYAPGTFSTSHRDMIPQGRFPSRIVPVPMALVTLARQRAERATRGTRALPEVPAPGASFADAVAYARAIHADAAIAPTVRAALGRLLAKIDAASGATATVSRHGVITLSVDDGKGHVDTATVAGASVKITTERPRVYAAGAGRRVRSTTGQIAAQGELAKVDRSRTDHRPLRADEL